MVSDWVPGWVPVLKVSDSIWMGVIAEELWTGDAQGRARKVNFESPIDLFPMLERGRAQVFSDVESSAALGLLPPEYSSDLSWLDSIADYVCRSVDWSGYWVSLALSWIEEKGGTLTDSEVEMLHKISQGKYSQKTKHHAWRLVKPYIPYWARGTATRRVSPSP